MGKSARLIKKVSGRKTPKAADASRLKSESRSTFIIFLLRNSFREGVAYTYIGTTCTFSDVESPKSSPKAHNSLMRTLMNALGRNARSICETDSPDVDERVNAGAIVQDQSGVTAVVIRSKREVERGDAPNTRRHQACHKLYGGWQTLKTAISCKPTCSYTPSSPTRTL